MNLPRELLENIYKFCNIDTRLELNKMGIHQRIKLKKQLSKNSITTLYNYSQNGNDFTQG